MCSQRNLFWIFIFLQKFSPWWLIWLNKKTLYYLPCKQSQLFSKQCQTFFVGSSFQNWYSSPVQIVKGLIFVNHDNQIQTTSSSNFIFYLLRFLNASDRSISMLQLVANDAEIIWNKMVDLRDTSIRLPHDGYLKLWQLSRPRLQNYDIIMIDEAQDITPGGSLPRL